jgi:hypothetical protein
MESISSKLKRKFIHLKPEVISLRKLGKSYSEIRKIYLIPKSTLSDWLKDIKMDPKIETELEKRAYEKLKEESKKKRERALKLREAIINKAKQKIKKIDKRDLLLIATALYWAEGNIKNKNRFQFGNSNPSMIKLMMRCLKEVCNIPEERIKARVHIYPGMNYSKVINFWLKITKLPKENFYPPQIQVSKASKGKRAKNTLPYGTLHLTVGSTELACKVKGWIQGICENALRE